MSRNLLREYEALQKEEQKLKTDSAVGVRELKKTLDEMSQHGVTPENIEKKIGILERKAAKRKRMIFKKVDEINAIIFAKSDN